MTDEQAWDDESRTELTESIEEVILGELRLAKYSRDEILDICREHYIEEDSPENEREQFIQFAADELKRAAAQLESEQKTWPAVTDCDRLDRVEIILRERDILLWQASPCCDTCTGSELPDRIEMIGQNHPGFEVRVRGYAFFIDQNMPEELAEGTEISICLAYGWFSPDESEVSQEVYEKNALDIAQEVCDCLRNEGFEPEWDGSIGRKICLSVNWCRRSLLK